MLPAFLVLCVVGLVSSLPLDDDLIVASDGLDSGVLHCGYESCPKTDPGVLNVHIVAHTHDDVGWLKTVDQYYYGSRNNIQKAGVQYILDSVIKELWEDPKRKFIYVETAFFWKWWVRQPESVQQKVRTLVREGRLQFVGGAWSMNDEAAAHYHSTVDQFTWGLSKINETFGPCALPRVGWQIDPFGHSREFASLLAGMGYDGLFLGRIDYQDKQQRLRERRMETLWRGDDDLGKPSDIFTGVLYNTYSPPPGFCFDVLCSDEPIIDDPSSPLFNVEDKISMFIDYVQKQSNFYRSNNVIVTMGGDFTYQDAAMWYINLDKLIQYTNLKAAKDGLSIKLFYSTPNCYLKAVKEANPTLPTKQDDYFPYASDSHSYWTGYFTSRPTTKYFERRGNVYLQMAKQLQVLADLEEHNQFVINELKSAMGVMQHHDAITGTEKQHVAHDYERILDQAIEDSILVPRQAFNKMMQGSATEPPLFSFDRCRLNESSCYTSENSDRFVVTLYNPVAWQVKQPVRVPVKDGLYEVYAPNGHKIDSQIVPIPKQVIDIPTRKSEATHEIVFIAYLKPLFYKSFYIKKVKKIKRDVEVIKPIYGRNKDLYENVNDYWKDIKEKADIEIRNIEDNDFENVVEVKIPIEPVKFDDADVKSLDLDVLKDDKNRPIDIKVKELENIIQEAKGSNVKWYREISYPNLNDEELRMLADDPMVVDRLDDFFVLENGNMKLHIDNTSGAIKHVTYPDGSNINLTINFFYYPGCIGDNREAKNRSSGAYIFRPNASEPIALKKLEFDTIDGNVVKELRMSWSDNVFSTARIYDGLEYLEIDWLVGPIDVEDGIGKEFIVKYETDIVNNGEFYTDSNGRQMLKRKLNERAQYNVSLAERIAGNYYPITNEIYIENDEERLAVVTDRSQGGTSLVEGEIELMLHRRLLHDDAFGVDEALNENVNGTGLVARGTHKLMLSPSKNNQARERKHVIETDLEPITFVSETNMNLDDWFKLSNCFSWLKSPLPEGLHLLTLEPWGSKLLLRLENYLTKSDSSTVEVDLTSILQNVKVKSFKETVLSGNEWINSRATWEWRADNEFYDNFNKVYGKFDGDSARDNLYTEDEGFKVKLSAKQIRTFIVDYEMYP